MRLYYADIRGADERDALYPPLSKSRGSALGVSLLAEAYRDYAGAPLPKLARLLSGKAYAPGSPELHFSISHSRTHVFCALSEQPVGVDTETHRFIRQSVIDRLTTPEELSGLSFFDIWVLRESLFKLTGEGELRSMRFYLRAGQIVPPVEGISCRLYRDIEGSSSAVACYGGGFPDTMIRIPTEKILRKGAFATSSPESKAR